MRWPCQFVVQLYEGCFQHISACALDGCVAGLQQHVHIVPACLLLQPLHVRQLLQVLTAQPTQGSRLQAHTRTQHTARRGVCRDSITQCGRNCASHHTTARQQDLVYCSLTPAYTTNYLPAHSVRLLPCAQSSLTEKLYTRRRPAALSV